MCIRNGPRLSLHRRQRRIARDAPTKRRCSTSLHVSHRARRGNPVCRLTHPRGFAEAPMTSARTRTRGRWFRQIYIALLLCHAGGEQKNDREPIPFVTRHPSTRQGTSQSNFTVACCLPRVSYTMHAYITRCVMQDIPRARR